MKIPVRFSLYIARQFFQNFLMVFLVIMAVLILIDVVDLIRRSYIREIPFAIVLQMAILKFPIGMQKLIAFVIMISSVLTFVKLTRTQELIVARASGISVWQFIRPALVTSFIIGLFVIMVFNPLACAMLGKYDKLMGKYIHGRNNLLEISSTGLWLRQRNYPAVDDGDKKNEPGETIIHALRASKNNMDLEEVVIFVFGQVDKFSYRIDARRANLEDGYWHLYDSILTFPDRPGERHPEYLLPTDLTASQIQDSFAPPETISFWSLPGFINTLKNAGFSAVRHKVYWFSLLVIPFLLASMVFIAAAFSLRSPRQGRIPMLIGISVGVGFMIYFLSDLVSALALSGSIPIPLAAWAPVAINIMLGIALLMHLEDG